LYELSLKKLTEEDDVYKNKPDGAKPIRILTKPKGISAKSVLGAEPSFAQIKKQNYESDQNS
jgi:hypothetical protein